jgi:ABC-type multidrug transport system fused ATPase/permease subunit
MPVDDNSILQTDATVIAGVLILLTLTSVGGGLTTIVSDFFTLAFTAVAIVPFAASAMSIIQAKLTDGKENMDKNSRKARQLTAAEFLYLIGVVIILDRVNVYEFL